MFGFEFSNNPQILEAFNVEYFWDFKVFYSWLRRVCETEQFFTEGKRQQSQKIVGKILEDESDQHESNISHSVFSLIPIAELQTLIKARCCTSVCNLTRSR